MPTSDSAKSATPRVLSMSRDAAAATDAFMRAEILTYSRSRGLFAGISLEGSTLRQDNGANQKIYGRKITAREIVRGGAGTPAGGATMVSTLNQHSPRNLSEPKSLKAQK
jgi:lipid-binding SYLF domain-containing protein